jgi:hypothetical protein
MIRSRFSILNKWRLCVFWGTAFFWSLAASAQELAEGVQTHGFISQSVVRTSDNNVGGDSDDKLAWDLREMGVNLSWRPNPDWLISGQVLARWAGDTDEGDFRLDYGFVDRAFYNSGEVQVGARLGKVKNPYGFFNTTRDVAQTRPGIIMPQSIYLDQVRNFFLAAPGISLYGNADNEQGALSWQVSAMRPEVDDVDLEYMTFLRDLPGKFAGRNSWLGQVMLDRDGGRWRIGASLGEMNMHYQPGGSPPFDLLGGTHRLPTWVLSMQHNSENWTFTAEYAQTEVIARNYGPVFDDNTIEAGYLQATRRFADSWQGYLRYDVLYLDRDDRDGMRFASFSPGVAAHSRFAKDWVVGVRRDMDRLALSAEVHHVDGTAWLARVDNPEAGLVRKWDMLLLQAAWRF